MPATELKSLDRLERRAHAIIATMEAADGGDLERREVERTRYIARAEIRLIDPHGDPGQAMTLYTRDITENGVGFILPGDVQADSHALIQMHGPTGRFIEAEAELIRTESFAHGWREGYAKFARPVNLFCDEPIRVA